MRFAGLWREPVLHFFLIGIGIFAYYGHVSPGSGDDRQIHISRLQVDALARQHQKLWGRLPQPEELASLVEAAIRDEVLYREGKALGLDDDDPVIKRRVRQKLEISTEELLGQEEATDAALSAYLLEHADRFTPAPRISFEQVPVPAGGSPRDEQARAASLLEALNAGTDPSLHATGSLLPTALNTVPLDLVARDFGRQFGEQLRTLPLGSWQGPVVSGYGLHLVRISERDAGQRPSLDQVRPQVEREWESDRRERGRELVYQAMRAEYRITVEADLPVKPAP